MNHRQHREHRLRRWHQRHERQPAWWLSGPPRPRRPSDPLDIEPPPRAEGPLDWLLRLASLGACLLAGYAGRQILVPAANPHGFLGWVMAVFVLLFVAVVLLALRDAAGR